MKKIVTLIMLFFVVAIHSQSNETGNKGNNFSLEGALAMLKKANNLEEFEKMLNEQDNNINNLDLDNDKKTDYINVSDNFKDGVHQIEISTNISQNQKQEIATIGIQKTDSDKATLQIEGNQELYASNAIIEPSDFANNPQTSKGGPRAAELVFNGFMINVWPWPCVQFIFAPNYIPWASPYNWGHYPHWWQPWHPFRYSNFYHHCAPYSAFYQPAWHRAAYMPQYSIKNRYHNNNYRNNHYRNNNRNSYRNFYRNSYRNHNNQYHNNFSNHRNNGGHHRGGHRR